MTTKIQPGDYRCPHCGECIDPKKIIREADKAAQEKANREK